MEGTQLPTNPKEDYTGMGFVSGWGKTEKDPYPNKLQGVKLPIISDESKLKNF